MRTTRVFAPLAIAALAGAAAAQCSNVWITPTDRGEQEHFGSSVAMNPSWIAVGTPWDDNARGNNAGAVFLFQRSGGGATQVFKAVPGSAGDNYEVGQSVSMDATRVIMGGSGEYDAGDKGVAYIYRLAGGSWVGEQTLLPGLLEFGDEFGAAVGIHGNVAVVGAPGDDDHASHSGRVYLYKLVGNTWTLGAFPSIPQSVDGYFGYAVATHSERVAVAAPYIDYTLSPTTYQHGGEVYMFSPNASGGFDQDQVITGPVPQAHQGFGNSLDMDADRMAIGAPGTDVNGVSGAGAVYIYERQSGNHWEFVQQIVAPVPAPGEWFGHNLSLDGGDLLVKSLVTDYVLHYRRNAAGDYTLQGRMNRGLPGTPAYGSDIAVSAGLFAIGDDLSDDNAPASAGAVNLVLAVSPNGADTRVSAPTLSLPASTTGCTANATNDGSTTCGQSNSTPDVWHKIQTTTAGTLTVTTAGSGFDTVLSIHDTAGTSLLCNDDANPGESDGTSRIAMGVTAGQTLYVRVSGYLAAKGSYALQARISCRADLTTAAIPGATYGVPNGVLNNDDFFYFLSQFAAGNYSVADLTASAIPGSAGYAQPNNIINNDDFFYYLSLFSAGC